MESLDHHLLPPLDPLSLSPSTLCAFYFYSIIFSTSQRKFSKHTYVCVCMCTSKSSLSHECTIHLNAKMYTSLKMIYFSLQPVESDSYNRTPSRSGIRKCLGEMFTERRHQLKYQCGSSEHLWANIRCLLKRGEGNSIQGQPWLTSPFHQLSAMIGVTGTDLSCRKRVLSLGCEGNNHSAVTVILYNPVSNCNGQTRCVFLGMAKLNFCHSLSRHPPN